MNRRHWCLAAVLIGSASATLMQNFITVSLPTIASELAGHSTVGWVVGAYMLASTAVLLNSGRWADRQGPRKVYVVGTLLYATATVLTSQSQSMVQLIIFRAIQGLGAGIIVPASMAAVTRYWRDKRLGRIIGLLGSMQVVATLIGAPLGGLADLSSRLACGVHKPRSSIYHGSCPLVEPPRKSAAEWTR